MVVAVVAGVVVVAAASGLILHDSAKPASVADAISRFRAGGSARGKLDGVYLYATSGGESVDALGGAKHRYPATTSLTAVGVPCGVKLRWDALQGRTATWTLCATSRGTELRSEDVVHRFFGQTDDTNYECSGTILLPASEAVGSTSPLHCRSRQAGQAGVARVVGRETITVGGRRLNTVHVRTKAEIAGGDNGDETVDWWLDAASGLPVRIAMTSRTSRKTVIGRVHYAEDVQLRLVSTTPKR